MSEPGAQSLQPNYFDAIYQANADPWNFTKSEYEAAKYADTLAALPHERYRNGFEIGCSIGVLTQRLAVRCAALLAIDVSEQALQAARNRGGGQPQLRLLQMQFPRQYPTERFDMVLMSEVGYYWSRNELALARRRIVELLEPGGDLLLVHWTPPVEGYPLSGDAVHDAFLRDGSPVLEHVRGHRRERYRLDLFRRTATAAVPHA